MGTSALADAIREKLEFNHVSFAELMRIPGVQGDLEWYRDGEDFGNIILWSGLSQEAFDILQAMIKAGECHLVPTSLLIYLADGEMLRLPLVKRIMRYKTPHWLPCVLNRGPAKAQKKREIRRASDRRAAA
jgi:hypothetical protein